MTKNILDLNDDCLLHICSFLDTFERLQFATILSRFQCIVDRLFRSSNAMTFINNTSESIPIEMANQTFSRIGSNITRFYLAEENFSDYLDDYVKSIAIFFPNLEYLDLEWFNEDAFQIQQRLFTSCKKLKILKLRESHITDEIASLIAQLRDLVVLDLSDNHLITGKHLKKLTKLVELRISNCWNFETKHFIEICNATKLQKLDIRCCKLLFKDAFETLVETQTALEYIKVGTTIRGYSGAIPPIVAQLKSLKQIALNFNATAQPTQLLNELIRDKKHCLEFFEIDWDNLTDEYNRSALMQFSNLRELLLMNATHLSSLDLKKIAKSFPMLTRFQCFKAIRLEQRHLVRFVKRAKKLKILEMSFCDPFDSILYDDLVAVMKRKEVVPLVIYSTDHTIRDLVKTENYNRNKAWLLLRQI